MEELLIRVRDMIVTFFCGFIYLFLAMVGEDIVSFGGDSGFQINDPVMFCLYIATGAIGIILFIISLSLYRRKRKVDRKLKALEGEMKQRLYESYYLKNTEKRKGYGNDSNNGYLVCEECKGYYMLEKGEYPQEFNSCQCGGNLIYYNDLEFLKDDDFKNENRGIIN